MAEQSPLETDCDPAAITSGLARGDDRAWTLFHREYGPGLFHRLLALAQGDAHLAREALQLAYLRIARHARPTDSSSQFSAWLRLVIRSALADARRRRRSFFDLIRRRSEDPMPWAESGEPEDTALQLGMEQALEKALALLNSEDRLLLQGKYYENRDVRTLAAELGISPKAAESRLTRARANLRQYLTRQLALHEKQANAQATAG